MRQDPRRRAPRDHVGEPVVEDERGEFLHAGRHVTNNRSLWDALLTGQVPRRIRARLLAEFRVHRHAVTLGLAQRRPVALGVVGDEHAADDADATVVGLLAGRERRCTPFVEHHARVALRQHVHTEANGASDTRGTRGCEPDRRSPWLNRVRRDVHVVELVALAAEREPLTAPRQLQDLHHLLGKRHTVLQRDTERAELVRCVRKPEADLHPPVRDLVEHRNVLSEPQGVLERGQRDIGRDTHALGDRCHCAGYRHHAGQIPIVHEVVLAEPGHVEARFVEHRDLFECLAIDVLHGVSAAGRTAEVVDYSEADGRGHDQTVRGPAGTCITRHSVGTCGPSVRGGRDGWEGHTYRTPSMYNRCDPASTAAIFAGHTTPCGRAKGSS
uniref:Unannotated protein n=1 Tax=freshwater metagenome TaxID=449393 RepID=A0A6J7PNF3_9ZZZZ